MSNSFATTAKLIRQISKHNKFVKFSSGLVISFLLSSSLTISNTENEIKTNFKSINEQLKISRKDNRKKLKIDEFELIKLEEQGNQVVKSPWSSWIFSAGYYHDINDKTITGKNDKAKNGQLNTSGNIFDRVVSPNSAKYGLLGDTSSILALNNSSTNSGQYGLVNLNKVEEELVSLDVSASIRPKQVVKPSIVMVVKDISNPNVVAINPVNTPNAPVIAAPIISVTPPAAITPISLNPVNYNAVAFPSVSLPVNNNNYTVNSYTNENKLSNIQPTGDTTLYSSDLGSMTGLLQVIGIEGTRPLISGTPAVTTTTTKNINYIINHNLTVQKAGSRVLLVESHRGKNQDGTVYDTGDINQVLKVENKAILAIDVANSGGNIIVEMERGYGNSTGSLNQDYGDSLFVNNVAGLLTSTAQSQKVIGVDFKSLSSHLHFDNFGKMILNGSENVGVQTDEAGEIVGIYNHATGIIETNGNNSIGVALKDGNLDGSKGATPTHGTFTGYTNLPTGEEFINKFVQKGIININGNDPLFPNSTSYGIVVQPNVLLHIDTSNEGIINVNGKNNVGIFSNRTEGSILTKLNTVNNKGTINVTGTNSIGMRVDRYKLENFTNGIINILNTSGVSNAVGMISSNQIGATEITNNGNIKLTLSDGIENKGMFSQNRAGVATLINNGTIELNLSGTTSKNIGLAALATNINNSTSSQILINDTSSGGSAGIYINGGTLDTSGLIKIDGSSTDTLAIYGANGSILNTTGTITLNAGKGIYTDGGTLNIGSGTAPLIMNGTGSNSIGIIAKNNATINFNKDLAINISGSDNIGFYADGLGVYNLGGKTVTTTLGDGGLGFYIVNPTAALALNVSNINVGSSTATKNSGGIYMTSNDKIDLVTADINVGTLNSNGRMGYGIYAETATPLTSTVSAGNITVNENQGVGIYTKKIENVTANNITAGKIGVYIDNTSTPGNLTVAGSINVSDNYDDRIGIYTINTNVNVNSLNVAGRDKTVGAYITNGSLTLGNSSITGGKESVGLIVKSTGGVINTTTGTGNIALEDNSVGVYLSNTNTNMGLTSISVGDSSNPLANQSIGLFAENTTFSNVGDIMTNITTKNNGIGVYFGNGIANVSYSGNLSLGENSIGIYKKGTTISRSPLAQTIFTSTSNQNGIGYYLDNSNLDFTSNNLADFTAATLSMNEGIAFYLKGSSSVTINGAPISEAYINQLTGLSPKVERFVYSGFSQTIVDNINLSSTSRYFGHHGDSAQIILNANITTTDNLENTYGILVQGRYTTSPEIKVNNGAVIDFSSSIGSIALEAIDGARIENDGHIKVGESSATSSSVGIYGDSNATDQTILTNNNTLEVSGSGIGIFLNSTELGGTVTNNGMISSSGSGIGIYSKQKNPIILGLATITNTTNGKIQLGNDSIGMFADNSILDNQGEISIGSKVNNNPIAMYGKNNSIVNNSNTITTGTNGIAMYGNASTVQNSGFLNTGNSGISIYLEGAIGSTATNSFINVANDKAVGVYLNNGSSMLTNQGSMSIGNDSFGFLLASGAGNTLTTGMSPVTMQNDSVFIYSENNSDTVINNTDIVSAGNKNYGVYGAGNLTNNANINFATGTGNVGMYSTYGGTAVNNNTITTGVTDTTQDLYSIGMAAGYYDNDSRQLVFTGNIINDGTINVNQANSIGMYAVGNGSTAINDNNGVINLSGLKQTIGMYLDNGAKGTNDGTITTVGSAKDTIGVVVLNGAEFINNGKIYIDAENGVGIYARNGIIKNYGIIQIVGTGNAVEIQQTTNASQGIGGLLSNSDDMATLIAKIGGNITGNVTILEEGNTSKDQNGVSINTKNPKVIINIGGVPVEPETVNTTSTNLKDMQLSDKGIGMYIDTSNKNYTSPILGLNALSNLKEADLIIGAEAADGSNKNAIKVGDDILKPYLQTILGAPNVAEWNIYSASKTWMASGIFDTMNNKLEIYMARVPYTQFAGLNDNGYNFTDGLEQRYSANDLDSREKELFNKLNRIGNNEESVLAQAFDEMMGHPYANVQQRMLSSNRLLDSSISNLFQLETKSKQSNKVRAIGNFMDYKTDTHGIVGYDQKSTGIVYLNEHETVKLGNSQGWYAGLLYDRFEFDDIGESKENAITGKIGLYKSMAFDNNGELNWTIKGDVSGGYHRMDRKYLIVDEIFNAKGNYYSYGVNVKNEISKDFRIGKNTKIGPIAILELGYGKYTNIKEDTGEIKLDVKGNDYYTIKPAVGGQISFSKNIGQSFKLSTRLIAVAEKELGETTDIENKARINGTTADYYNLRKDDSEKFNAKVGLNLNLGTDRFSFELNGEYNTEVEKSSIGAGFNFVF